MKEFVRRHGDHIHGVLSCFDRMLLRGHLPIMSGWSMAQFLKGHGVGNDSLKAFLLENAERVKAHAIALAKKHERPYQYLTNGSKIGAWATPTFNDGLKPGRPPAGRWTLCAGANSRR